MDQITEISKKKYVVNFALLILSFQNKDKISL